MGASKRRSRMRRISTGKRVELTERDIELFKLLHRYQYLRSNFLYAFLGGSSETRFKERLGQLYHDGGYINRPQEQWLFANCRYMPVVYEIDEKGEGVLRDLGLAEEGGPPRKKRRTGAYRHFAHELMTCECLASIELGVRQDPTLRLVPWREILAKAPEETQSADNPLAISVSISPTLGAADTVIVPDALFGLEYTVGQSRTYRFFALEADRGTMPVARQSLDQSSYFKKLLAYRDIEARQVYRSRLGLPNLLILTVTTNEERTTNIMELLSQLTEGRGSKTFLFKTVSTLANFHASLPPDGRMLTAPWKRVTHEELYINRP